jgi:hypothetical protein
VDDDLAKLRKDHPGWNFGTVWASAASGPDARRLWATRDGMLLSAWTAAELARNIRQEDKGHPGRRMISAGPPHTVDAAPSCRNSPAAARG